MYTLIHDKRHSCITTADKTKPGQLMEVVGSTIDEKAVVKHVLLRIRNGLVDLNDPKIVWSCHKTAIPQFTVRLLEPDETVTLRVHSDYPNKSDLELIDDEPSP